MPYFHPGFGGSADLMVTPDRSYVPTLDQLKTQWEACAEGIQPVGASRVNCVAIAAKIHAQDPHYLIPLPKNWRLTETEKAAIAVHTEAPAPGPTAERGYTAAAPPPPPVEPSLSQLKMNWTSCVYARVPPTGAARVNCINTLLKIHTADPYFVAKFPSWMTPAEKKAVKAHVAAQDNAQDDKVLSLEQLRSQVATCLGARYPLDANNAPAQKACLALRDSFCAQSPKEPCPVAPWETVGSATDDGIKAGTGEGSGEGAGGIDPAIEAQIKLYLGNWNAICLTAAPENYTARRGQCQPYYDYVCANDATRCPTYLPWLDPKWVAPVTDPVTPGKEELLAVGPVYDYEWPADDMIPTPAMPPPFPEELPPEPLPDAEAPPENKWLMPAVIAAAAIAGYFLFIKKPDAPSKRSSKRSSKR